MLVRCEQIRVINHTSLSNQFLKATLISNQNILKFLKPNNHFPCEVQYLELNLKHFNFLGEKAA